MFSEITSTDQIERIAKELATTRSPQCTGMKKLNLVFGSFTNSSNMQFAVDFDLRQRAALEQFNIELRPDSPNDLHLKCKFDAPLKTQLNINDTSRQIRMNLRDIASFIYHNLFPVSTFRINCLKVVKEITDVSRIQPGETRFVDMLP